jgi:hypothetical protein
MAVLPAVFSLEGWQRKALLKASVYSLAVESNFHANPHIF